MSLTDPLYVIAYDRAGFEAWCTRRGINPDSRAVRYVRDVNVLNRLRHDVRILFVYGWQERRDGRALYNRAMVIGRRPS